MKGWLVAAVPFAEYAANSANAAIQCWQLAQYGGGFPLKTLKHRHLRFIPQLAKRRRKRNGENSLLAEVVGLVIAQFPSRLSSSSSDFYVANGLVWTSKCSAFERHV
jgi:hypothetical protein